MRGRHEEQEVMLAYVNLEGTQRPSSRTIKAVADEALNRLSPETGCTPRVGPGLGARSDC